MSRPAPAEVYRAYVDALNAHAVTDLSALVADRLTYNDAPLTRADYEAMLAGDVATFPDLFFDVREVVAEGDRLAARIHFEVTPVATWRGREPDGRRVRFDEHVFYRFEGGRIAEVHSIIAPPEDRVSVEPDRSLLRPGLRLVIAGTVGRHHRPAQYYAGPGNRFFELLQGSGLVDERLDPDHVDRLPDLGVGLTDLVLERVQLPGREPEAVIYRSAFDRAVRDVSPLVVAFVSKTAATWYARSGDERHPKGYGELEWPVAGVPGFVLPGPSGANNGMPLALRLALWTDLADFLEHLDPSSRGRL